MLWVKVFIRKTFPTDENKHTYNRNNNEMKTLVYLNQQKYSPGSGYIENTWHYTVWLARPSGNNVVTKASNRTMNTKHRHFN